MGFEKGIWPVFIESVNREHTASKLVEGRGYGTGLYFEFSVSTVQSWPEPRAPQNHPIPIQMVTAFRGKPVPRQRGHTIVPINSSGVYL